MKRWTIYCHTHISTGRRYIGLTSQTMEKRWKNHINAAKNSKNGRWHFPNAIRKYGPDAFTHEVLAQSWDLDGANATECAVIAQEGTRDPKLGFNTLKGGGLYVPSPTRRNPWDNPGYRAKFPKDQARYFHTPQARAASKAALNTLESKAKRSAAALAASTSEVRAKTSAAIKIKWDDPEYRAKFPKDRIKQCFTPRARAANKAALNTLEVRAKISAAVNMSNTPEVRVKRSAAIKALWSDSLYKAKRSAVSKAMWNNSEMRIKILTASKATINTSESRAKRSNASKIALNTPESKAKRSAIIKKALNTSESKAKRSAISKSAWDDCEYRSKVKAAVKAAANTSEALAKRMTSSSIYQKICSKCHIEKSLDNFYKHKEGQFGVIKVCKECCRRDAVVYYKSNLLKLQGNSGRSHEKD